MNDAENQPNELEPWLADALGIPNADAEAGEDRDELGRFQKGCKPGPGRPKGALDFGKVAREACERTGSTLEEAAEKLYRTLFLLATKKGDVGALRMLLDRIFGRVPRETRIEIEGAVPVAGPALPADFNEASYLAKLAEIAAKDYSPAARARPPQKDG